MANAAGPPVAARLEISIELCGEVRLEVDGRRRERELPGRLGRVLLGYLALNRRRAVTRDELIEALWPQGAPGGPRRDAEHAALRRCAACSAPSCLQGRASCGSRCPTTRGSTSSRRRADLERGRPEPALDVLERTLLPGFDAPWLDAAPARARGRAARRAGAAGARGLDAGSPHRALAAARRIVALAPVPRVRLRAADGRAGGAGQRGRGAADVTSACARCIRDELGARRRAELRAAHQRLLEQRATRRSRRCPRALARPAGRRFVGRAGAAGARCAAGSPRRRRSCCWPASRDRQDEPRRRVRPRGAERGDASCSTAAPTRTR